MSFDATGGLVQSASDIIAVGIGRGTGAAPTRNYAGSASYVLTVTGDTTFTAKYRLGAAGTSTFYTSQIIVQVY
jgi:hypothetical protein